MIVQGLLTKSVLQNAFCANMQSRPPFPTFFTKSVLQNAFCANMQFRPLFSYFFFTKSVLQNTLFAKVALQAPKSQYFRPAERYCEQMHQRGPPKTPKTSKTHRTIKNILPVSCTIVFDGWNQWYRHIEFNLYSWAAELRRFSLPLFPWRNTTTSSQNSESHPKQGRKVVGVSTVKGT